jgi:hypothetical protein
LGVGLSPSASQPAAASDVLRGFRPRCARTASGLRPSEYALPIRSRVGLRPLTLRGGQSRGVSPETGPLRKEELLDRAALLSRRAALIDLPRALLERASTTYNSRGAVSVGGLDCGSYERQDNDIKWPDCGIPDGSHS